MTSTMDSVEKLFKALPELDSSGPPDTEAEAHQLCTALEAFVNEPPSQDPDYQYLLDHAHKALEGNFAAAYFRQQLAGLGTQKPVQRKDKSVKARQLKYYKWLACGMKNETWPFEKGKARGCSSTARIATLANPTSCASCHRPGANMRCPDCNFQDDRHVVQKTSYCNKKCLKDHYDTHRQVCEGRLMVYRAALILESIFMAMAEATNLCPVGTFYEKNGILYFNDDLWHRAGMTGRPIFHPFPKHLVESVEMHHALLLWSQCREPSLSLFPLINFLFKAICRSMDLMFVQPKNVIRPICQLCFGRSLNLCLHRHIVLRLTLKSDEQYVIDLTAAQFGWKETLAPWETWMDLRAARSQPDAFKPAHAEMKAFVHSHGLEAHQQEIRGAVVRSIVNELNGDLRGARNHLSFDKVLKVDKEIWKRTEYEIIQTARQRIYLLVTSEYHKSRYRLWLGSAPTFGPRLAGDQARALKSVWVSAKEFERLKNSGANMNEAWEERVNKKFKQGAAGGDA